MFINNNNSFCLTRIQIKANAAAGGSGQAEHKLWKQQQPLQNSKKIFFLISHDAGRPGVDYPILSQFPYTNFYCDEQEYPGFFADMETRCQGKLLPLLSTS